MSQENVEIVRRAYESFNAGQDEWLSMLHPEVEVRLSGVFPGIDSDYRGHDGARRFRDTLFEAWEYFHAEPREIVDRGAYVGVVVDLRAKGRESGAEVNLTFHQAFRFDGDLVVRWASFPTLREAREAAGLRE